MEEKKVEEQQHEEQQQQRQQQQQQQQRKEQEEPRYDHPFPFPVVAPLQVGQAVSALHPTTRHVHTGTVLTVDWSRGKNR